MISLTHISPEELTEGDVELLVKVGLRAYHNPSASMFVEKELAGILRFFRISGDMVGLVGVERHLEKWGLEMWVSFIGGKGGIRFIREIWQELQELQKSLGAVTIATMAPSPALTRVYERRLGLRPASTLFREGKK